MSDDRQRTTATAVCLPSATALDDHAFLRYSRQLLLEDIGIEGQKRLLAALNPGGRYLPLTRRSGAGL
ncbi:hypothetical protein [Sodalis glossinidius]|uniref:hypothetical protein n=1 Tax=Sodalis glossinidius TaxID=63612 RepID=UPI0005A46634